MSEPNKPETTSQPEPAEEIMSAPPRTQHASLFSTPQVIAAVITGLISLAVAIVGILPELIKQNAAQPPSNTPTVLAAVIATFTPAPVEPFATTTLQSIDTSLVIPVVQSETPVASALSPTQLPVLTVPPTVDISAQPNLRLYFDNASFTILKLRGGRKILSNVSFSGAGGGWNASQWGLIHEEFLNDKCLRLRDATTSRRDPPSPCVNNLLSLMEVGPAAIFWRDDNGFTIQVNGSTVATCTESPCEIALP
jgi:hypothetical protein